MPLALTDVYNKDEDADNEDEVLEAKLRNFKLSPSTIKTIEYSLVSFPFIDI